MAIVALQKINLAVAPATMEERIGRALCLQSIQHVVQFLGQRGLGFSYSSCNAAVAVASDPKYDSVNIGGDFSVVYGSSRLYQGLDGDFNAVHNPQPCKPFSNSLVEEHAEQSAIRVARSQGLPFWNHGGHNHIYVDLIPCPKCDPWLRADASSWYVHYHSLLNNQAQIMNDKKRARQEEFGRQMEPAKKKLKG